MSQFFGALEFRCLLTLSPTHRQLHLLNLEVYTNTASFCPRNVVGVCILAVVVSEIKQYKFVPK